MRHLVDHRKLGRTSSHRRAMLANMVTSLFAKERITTTAPKAKEARRYAERLITRAKKGFAAYKEHQSLKEAGKEDEAKRMQAVALAHWRQASRWVRKRDVLKKLFDKIAPLYLERNGGYTRMLRVGNRLGDNAETVMLELVGTELTSEPKVRKKGGKKKEEAEGEAAEAAAGEKAETPEKKSRGRTAKAKEKAIEKEKKAAAPKERDRKEKSKTKSEGKAKTKARSKRPKSDS